MYLRDWQVVIPAVGWGVEIDREGRTVGPATLLMLAAGVSATEAVDVAASRSRTGSLPGRAPAWWAT
jgi:hypothetical protein